MENEKIFLNLFDMLVQENLKKEEFMESKKQFLSLYDYLGKPAGPELGKEVYQIAKFLGEKVTFKDVSNPKYKGKVVCYPQPFLNYVFTLPRVYQHLNPKQ